MTVEWVWPTMPTLLVGSFNLCHTVSCYLATKNSYTQLIHTHLFLSLGIELFNVGLRTDVIRAKAFLHANDVIDIYSNSWAITNRRIIVAGPGPLASAALARGTEQV